MIQVKISIKPRHSCTIHPDWGSASITFNQQILDTLSKRNQEQMIV